MIDCKISKRHDKDSFYCKFYEGAVTTEKELDLVKNKMVSVTRYRRTSYLGDRSFTVDPSNLDSVTEAAKDSYVKTLP